MILLRHGESEFNVVYKKTRIDPGIRDPKLTDLGHRQVSEAVGYLKDRIIKRILTSPYTRAIQTASIVAEAIGVAVEVDPRIGERAAFICDLGTPGADLRRAWPGLDLDHLEETWWPTPVESESALDERCLNFREKHSSSGNWQQTLVVSHWGFIRGLTGHTVGNAQLVEFDPRDLHPGGGKVVPMDIPC
jgi:glucosyl-3-phosphoglycerate phosphatase